MQNLGKETKRPIICYFNEYFKDLHMESCLPVNGQVSKTVILFLDQFILFTEAVTEREDHWTGTKNVYPNSYLFAHCLSSCRVRNDNNYHIR